MRVTKSQIVHGITDYIQSDILPKMGNGRGLQILLAVGASTVAANNKLVDAIFDNQIVRDALDEDGSGTYEISDLAESLTRAIQKYGTFPVKVPTIPFISPAETTFNLSADDITAMRARIESAV